MSYVTIQDWMLDLGLPMRETVLYALIYGFSQDGESKCYATQDYLCRWMSCTTPTLHKALNGLLERGLIVKEQPNPYGKCCYAATERGKETLCWGKETLPRQDKETLCQGKETLPNNKSDIKEVYKNKDNTYKADFTPQSKPDYEAEFKELWTLYPKKEGRQRALTAYTAARKKGVTLETIKAGVERYAAQVKAQATPAQYIKQGGNWFAAHRWEDDLLPADKAAQARETNPALQYKQHRYTRAELRSLGIDFGEDED